MQPKQQLILASQSLTRRQLLASAGLGVKAVSPRFDEEKAKISLTHLAPSELAMELAVGKASGVSEDHPRAIVIGADQTLQLRGAMLSKSRTRDEACAQLLKLRGERHDLHSAVVCVRGGEVLWRACDSAHLTMRQFSDDFLEEYLRAVGDDVMGSVGGYRIEGLGLQLFKRIEGDHFTILGLPLLPLLAFLRDEGVIAA